MRINYTFLILWLAIFIAVLYKNPLILCIYFLMVTFRSMNRKNKSINFIVSNIFLFGFYEVTLLFSFLFFWPKEKKIEYEQVL